MRFAPRHFTLSARKHDRTTLLQAPPEGRTHDLLSMGRNWVAVPGFRIEILNTLGAGDAFAAGLLRAWLDGCRTP